MLVDANQCYTRHLALRMGRELEKLNVPFFEEPLSIDDVDGHALLADKLDVRIATGENMYTRWDFLPFFQKNAIHVAQADASRCGGGNGGKRGAGPPGGGPAPALTPPLSHPPAAAAELSRGAPARATPSTAVHSTDTRR